MVMLRNRKITQYLIHHLPRTIGRQNGKSNEAIDNLVSEMKYLYRKLGAYDSILDYIGKVGI